MIVTKSFAETINRTMVADLATGFASGFARKLGHDERIVIAPEEVIYDPKEAERYFLLRERERYKKAWQESKEYGIADRIYMQQIHRCEERKIRRIARKRNPVVMSDTAYTPISGLSEAERQMVSGITGSTDMQENFALLYGFGAEIAHLVGKRLYGKNGIGGFGEALDCLSQLYEAALDVRTVRAVAGENHPEKTDIEKEYAEGLVNNVRRHVKISEALLFQGEAAAKRKAMEFEPMEETAEFYLLMGEYDYVNTRHLEGMVIFLEVYDRENGKVDNACRRLGNLLSSPDVRTELDVLRTLGVSEERLDRYGLAFLDSMHARSCYLVM